MVTNIGERANSRKECQMLLIKFLCQEHPATEKEYAVQPLEDTQVRVFINERTGKLNVWPTSRIEPYEITQVSPQDGHFNAIILLKPDWSIVDPNE